jgi:hypothetical protein
MLMQYSFRERRHGSHRKMAAASVLALAQRNPFLLS